MNGTKLRQVMMFTHEDVFVHPADPCRIRPQRGRDSRRQPARNIIEIFQNSAPGPVHVCAILEDDIDKRIAKKRVTSDDLRKRHGKHRRGQWVGHLILYHLRGLTRILREDDHLDIGQVWDGIQRHSSHDVDAAQDDKEGHQDDQELVLDRKLYNLCNHSGSPGAAR